MDVQTESTDPPPGESQPSGKIRKGFKLFGKRKPGNIFSIRNKGDGNNKSPVNKAKTPDGLETAAADTEQDSEKEKGQGVNHGDGEQTDEEPLGEDGVIAAAPARTSISSASSAKSLSFLSLLRGGRRGVLDRRVQTVSQPVGRQRRGIKGLFGNVKFRSKDKEDKEEKEEAPPSPLLMSSRTNSVEIIKEDLTLTPKSQPRSLDSPGTESCGPTKSLTTPDSPATSPSETMSPQMTAGNVSRTNEHVPPLPTTEPPMVPGENSLSTLLADISSLLTFDSISGGGDIMADVEAEWGKASGAISPAATEATASPTSLFSKPTMSSPLTSSSITTSVPAKPSSVAVSTTQTQALTSAAKTTVTSFHVAKPSTIITTLTKSSTLTTQTVKSGSASAPGPVTSITTKLTTTPTATTKPSSTPVTSTSVSAPIMSSPPITTKPTLDAPSTTAPPNTPAAVVKAPSASSTLTSTVSKLASEIMEHPKLPVAATKSCPVSSPFSAKPPLTHTPPTPATFTQSLSAKLDLTGSVNLQTFSSNKSSVTGELKPQATVSVASTVTARPSPPAPVVFSKTTPAPTSVSTPASVSTTVPKPIHTSSPMDLSKTPPSLATSAVGPPSSSAAPGLTKPPSGPASVPTLSAASLDKIPSNVPATAPTSLGKMPPPPTTTPAPASQTVAPPAPTTAPSKTPLPTKPTPAPAEVPVSQSKAPPASVAFTVSIDTPGPQAKPPPAPVAFSVSINDPVPVSQGKTPPAPVAFSVPKDAPGPVYQAKAPPSPAEILVSAPKVTTPQIPVSEPKASTPAPQIPVSVPKAPTPAPQIPVSVSKAPTPAPQIPVSEPKAPTPAPQIPLSVSKAPTPAPQIPVSVPKAPTPAPQIPVSVPKDPPAPVQIPLSQSKAPTPAPVPCPATSLSSSEASKMRDSGRGMVDGLLGSQKSADAQETQPVPSKTDELQNESRSNKEEKKRTPQAKMAGLSKIPVVGGGRAGKIPVRDSQHADEEVSRDPPTPVLEEVRPHFNSHDTGSKDKINNAEATVVTPKHSQEESLQLQQPKGSTCLQRDSKIPVKHGAQSHTASQIPQAKDPPRTKIPVSKVPVRRVGNKPGAASGSNQMRK